MGTMYFGSDIFVCFDFGLLFRFWKSQIYQWICPFQTIGIFFLSESKQINVVHVSHLGNEVCFWKPYVALNGPNVAVFPHWGQLIQLGGSRDTCQVTHSVMNMCSQCIWIFISARWVCIHSDISTKAINAIKRSLCCLAVFTRVKVARGYRLQSFIILCQCKSSFWASVQWCSRGKMNASGSFNELKP